MADRNARAAAAHDRPEANDKSRWSGEIHGSVALRFLAFRIGERRYALRAEDVAEVILVPAMTRVPQSPPSLLGLANLRGSVLPVASLRGLLGMPEAGATAATRALVFDAGKRVALVVDAVDDLVAVPPERMQMAQAELAAEPGERLNGSFQHAKGNQAIKVLDVSALLDAAFVQQKSAGRQVRPMARSLDSEDAVAGNAGAEMLVTFEVAGQEFALAIDAVQEVVPVPDSRMAVPKAEALVLGVTSLRGTLLPLLSLRTLLGFPVLQNGSGREKVIVVKMSGAVVGLVADRARAIVSAESHLVEPIPPVLAARISGESRVRAIYRGDAGRRLISILAPEQLFREDVMQRLSAQRSGQQPLASRADAAPGSAGDLGFVVFRLGDDEFALPIDTVDEVAQLPAQITRVPKAPKFLEGVVNLRGEVLPIIDQRRRFDMPGSENPQRRRLVVVRTDRHRAGLIVDSVSDVLRIAADGVDAAPDLTDEIARLVRGVINLEASSRIVLVLDPGELLTRAERGLLDAFQSQAAQTASA